MNRYKKIAKKTLKKQKCPRKKMMAILHLKNISQIVQDMGMIFVKKQLSDLKEIEYCLENKLDLSCVDENKNNAIRNTSIFPKKQSINYIDMCSANGHVEILKQILESCKENGKQGLLNEQNSAGNTPLRNFLYNKKRLVYFN